MYCHEKFAEVHKRQRSCPLSVRQLKTRNSSFCIVNKQSTLCKLRNKITDISKFMLVKIMHLPCKKSLDVSIPMFILLRHWISDKEYITFVRNRIRTKNSRDTSLNLMIKRHTL